MLAVVSIFLGLSLAPGAFAADIPRLSEIFESGFDSLYAPRFCGENIRRLVSEAQRLGVDLSGAEVWKIVGAGFLETSGFYTRTEPNERVMLGYFHVVLVADGMVFDFDLHEPLVLELEDYIRLQFSPPRDPYVIFGMLYDAAAELPWWTVRAFDVKDYARRSSSPELWKKSMGEVVELSDALGRDRLR